MEFQPSELNDFSKGITDNFIGTAKEAYEKARNFFITPDGKIRVRDGSELDVSTLEARAKIPSNVRIDYMIQALDPNLPTLIHKIAGGKFYYDDGTTTLTELVGPASGHLFPATVIPSAALWNSHAFIAGYTSAQTYYKPQKVYPRGSAEIAPGLRLRTAGLPNLASDPSIATGTSTVIYGFCYKHTYNVLGRTFITRGPMRRVQTTAGGNGAAISSIVALANGTGDNYEISGAGTIVIEIYRTVAAGTVLFLVGSVNNGTTTYSDATSDASLVLNLSAYTNGGVVNNDPPPKCKFIHVAESGFAYYMNCIDPDSSDVLTNRLYQCKPDIIDAVPKTFFADLDDTIVGGSSFKGVPVIMGLKNIYRIDGKYDSFGAGGMIPQKIANFVGAIGHDSIVQTPDGIFFAGTDGFYWTDGYQVSKISTHLNTTYQTYVVNQSTTNQLRICGRYDGINRRVWWTFNTDSNNTDSDSVFALYLDRGISPASSFTILGGENFRASTLCFDTSVGYMFRGHPSGYCFRHRSSLTTDPRVNAAANVSTWGTSAIIYDWRSVYLDFGSTFVRKWVPWFLINLKLITNISLQVNTDRDLENSFKSCKPIVIELGFDWGTGATLWGDQTVYSLDKQIAGQQRRLPTPGIRCDYRQFQLTNAYTPIAKSDTLGLMTVSHGSLTATLVTGGNVLPLDLLDYFICFANDNYTAQFAITAFTTTQVTFSDPLSLAPANGNYKWMIKGYAKGHVLNLVSLVPHFAYLTSSQPNYVTGGDGQNA